MATLVKYIGKKKVAYDRLWKTGTIWYGPGDVQEVEDDEKAKLICGYSDELVKVDAESDDIQQGLKVPSSGPDLLHTTIVKEDDINVNEVEVCLADATRGTLEKYATEKLGLRVLPGHTKLQILKYIGHSQKLLSDLVSTSVANQDQEILMSDNFDVSTVPEPEPEPEPESEPEIDVSPEPKGLEFDVEIQGDNAF